MQYTIVHELPGRIRVHCPAACCGADYRLQLDRWLTRHEGLLSATLSTRTGNLLVRYAKSLDRETLLVMLDELQIFAEATITPRLPEPAEQIKASVAKTLLHEAEHLIPDMLLPRIINRPLAGMALGARIAMLLRSLAAGDIVPFMLGCAKMSVAALFGTSPILRFVFTVAVEFLGQPKKSFAAMHDFTAMPVFATPSGTGHALPLLPMTPLETDAAAI